MGGGGPEPGSLFGAYQVVAELGRGGMGRVYRARHVALDREVALKLLGEGLAAEPFFQQRFLKEARAAARLNHPNIVQIYDFGTVGEHAYLAMELVEGKSLSHLLKVWGRFPETSALAAVRQVAEALAVAHDAAIVHRDIKPDNLILGRKGVVKVVDLGLAKRVSDDAAASQTGFAAGTPHYMAPEQIEAQADIDGRADIYALGATLFHLVTGRVPFEGPSSAAILASHLRDPRPDPRDLAPELSFGTAALIVKAMAVRREDRHEDARAFQAEVVALLAGRAPAGAPDVPLGVESPAGATPLSLDGSLPETPPPVLEGLDPMAVRRLEDLLSQAIGPLAKLIVKRTARAVTSRDELCQKLAEQVPGAAERREFLAAALATFPRRTPPPLPPSAWSAITKASPAAPSVVASGPAAFEPSALLAAEKELAKRVGPLARVLVKRAAKSSTTWPALVASLAAEVPEGADRESFTRFLSGLAG